MKDQIRKAERRLELAKERASRTGRAVTAAMRRDNAALDEVGDAAAELARLTGLWRTK